MIDVAAGISKKQLEESFCQLAESWGKCKSLFLYKSAFTFYSVYCIDIAKALSSEVDLFMISQLTTTDIPDSEAKFAGEFFSMCCFFVWLVGWLGFFFPVCKCFPVWIGQSLQTKVPLQTSSTMLGYISIATIRSPRANDRARFPYTCNSLVHG